MLERSRRWRVGKLRVFRERRELSRDAEPRARPRHDSPAQHAWIQKGSLFVRWLTIVPAVVLCLTSCAAPSNSIGTPGIESASIKRGVTTESDLIAQLGPPQGRGLDSKGRRMLTWNRLDASATDKNEYSFRGTVFARFDKGAQAAARCFIRRARHGR
jgi:hypothetical protein